MDSQRWSNVCSLRDSYASAGPSVRGGPLEAFLELSARCNLRCKMCAIAYDTRYQGNGRPAFLTPDLFDRLRPIFPTLLRAHLYGLGEPVLNPRLTDYIRDLSAAGVEVWFTTNATLIDDPRADGFARAGADRISISIDGTTPEVYEEIRRGASFEALMKGLKALARARRRYGRPRLTVNFVAMASNTHQLPQLVDLCAEVGVEEINVEPLFYWGGSSPELDEHYQVEALSGDRFQSLMQDTRKQANDREIHFSSRFLTSEGSMDYRQRVRSGAAAGGWTCSEPWSTVYVTVAGEVRTCCLNDVSFGNLFEQPFDEIWNGDAFLRFRRQHRRSDEVPSGCGPCMENGRKRHSPLYDALEAISYRPLSSLSEEPAADPGIRLEGPDDGEVVTDPLIIRGRLPAGRLRQRLDRIAVLVDQTPVELLSSAVIDGDRFLLVCEIPFASEGAHVLSLAPASGGDAELQGLGWDRRLCHLWRPPQSRRRAVPSVGSAGMTAWLDRPAGEVEVAVNGSPWPSFEVYRGSFGVKAELRKRLERLLRSRDGSGRPRWPVGVVVDTGGLAPGAHTLALWVDGKPVLTRELERFSSPA